MVEAGPGASETDAPQDDDRAVGSLMRAGAPVESLEEQMALRELETKLFGRAPEPLRFARYVLLERLGEGASGLVYAAYDPTLERSVAIKLVQSRAEGESEGAARLLSEAQALARLSHPNVVAIYDARAYDETDLEQLGANAPSEVPRRGVFIVMERLRGQTLRDWAAEPESTGGPPLAARGRVLADAGRGLSAAHAAGLVHRDFKPENVVVLEDGSAKVLDFGLAAPSGADSSATMHVVGSEEHGARALAVVGTPAYMAPEQHVGDPADARSDQFAFACTAFEVLVGTRPFNGRSPRELALQKDEGEIGWPSSPEVPRSIVQAIERALRPDPKERLSSLDPLIELLDPKPRGRAWGWLLGLAGVGVAVAAFAFAPDARRDCEAGVQVVDELWTPQRGSTVASAFRGTELSYAEASLMSVQTGVEAWRDDWRRTRIASCARLEGEDAAKDDTRGRLAAELACLDRRLHDARAMVGMLERADADIVQHAATMVQELDPPETCLSGPAPVSAEAIDDEGAAALARARALRLAGKYADARLRLDELGQGTELSAASVLWGRIHMEHGLISLAEGRLEAAEESFLSAVVAAQRAGDAEVVADGWSKLAWAVGVELGRKEEGERYVRLAESAWASLPRVEFRLADIDHTRGGLAHVRQDEEEALAHYRRALERYEQVVGKRHPLVARTHSHLANVLIAQHRYEEALVQAQISLELRQEMFGETHPLLAGSLNNLAVIEMRRGEAERAFAHLARAREVAGPAQSSGLGIALLLSGEFSRDAGELRASRKYFEAYREWAKVHRPSNRKPVERARRELEKLDALEAAAEVPQP